jgi:deoxyribodipyrimidine photo-lyase
MLKALEVTKIPNYKYKIGLHIFRRDLRLEDNTSLIEALQSCERVIPTFIFDDRQIKDNDYKSDNAVQFMINSLKELNDELHQLNARLYFFEGLTSKVVESLIKTLGIEAVFVNEDYTPFSKKRDNEIKAICEKERVDFKEHFDVLLHEPTEVLKDNGMPYIKFTDFLKKSKKIDVREPLKNKFKNYFTEEISSSIALQVDKFPQNENLILKGGRKEGLSYVERIVKLKNYSEIRNTPSIDGTTKLSPHLKFGTVSVREAYKKANENFGNEHEIITELHWRDFFTHILYHFPYVLGNSFKEKYNQIPWENDLYKFKAWCTGRTGYPIVDAGMRQLNLTGWMHNRVRMITGSFLVKDLHIDWRWGEKYFAQKLVDYDPAINNGNWQWVASTGCDAQPFFRIFNPILQQQKFDPACNYIKTWLPELTDLNSEQIHTLNIPKDIDYPTPIVDHKIASEKAKKLYKI